MWINNRHLAKGFVSECSSLLSKGGFSLNCKLKGLKTKYYIDLEMSALLLGIEYFLESSYNLHVSR